MFQEVVIHYQLRKGLGPEWLNKEYFTAFDDLPEDVEPYQIYDMARKEFLQTRYRSEDYHLYGENWIIGEIELI